MIGLIDCDNFFCSCERVFRPDLRGKPVVVLSNNDGCVVARSPEVKALGIPEGMPYFKMMQQYGNCGIVAFSSNYALYADMSARVMTLLRQAVPDVLQYSIDEAFLDLEGMDPDTVKGWGEDLCARVLRSTGIPISLGIASSKTLAKMASKFAKRYPGYHKCCAITDERQRVAALRLFPVGDVWGIGRRIAATLSRYGVVTAYDFATRDRRWVRANFHVTGERTWAELNGESVIDVDGLDTVRKQTIVTSRSFPKMLTDAADLRAHVANYAARCALKLRKQGSVCATLSVFVQSNHFRPDLEQYDNQATATFTTPANDTTELVQAAMAVLHAIYRPGIRYKRAGVMVAGLTPAEALQPDLFYYDADRRRKYNDVSAVLDTINGRLGADTVVLGAQQYREVGPDGKSVKFVNAIRRALKSPDYSTSLGAMRVQ